MASRRWDEMSTRQRLVVILVGLAQITLAVSAWVDLARRPADLVRGPKRLWAAVIGINLVGPVSYFGFGRIRPPR